MVKEKKEEREREMEIERMGRERGGKKERRGERERLRESVCACACAGVSGSMSECMYVRLCIYPFAFCFSKIPSPAMIPNLLEVSLRERKGGGVMRLEGGGG